MKTLTIKKPLLGQASVRFLRRLIAHVRGPVALAPSCFLTGAARGRALGPLRPERVLSRALLMETLVLLHIPPGTIPSCFAVVTFSGSRIQF